MVSQNLGATRRVVLDGVNRAPAADGGNFRVECDHIFVVFYDEASRPQASMKSKNFLVCNSMENLRAAWDRTRFLSS